MKVKWGVVLTFSLFVVFLAGSPAQAAVSKQVSRAESRSTARFWTKDRIAAALQRDPVFDRRSGISQNSPQPRHSPVNVYRPEVGKILAWDHRGGFHCSGSVIDTRSMRLVLTAAHCLYSDGRWARKWIFMPDYRRGNRPFGRYLVKNAWVPTPWTRNSKGVRGMNFDIGLLVTRKRWNGTTVGENVGAIAIQPYPERRGVTDIYGYPVNWVRGEVMRTCRTFTTPDPLSARMWGPMGLLARCNLAAGSSGGPWVSRYRSKGGGTVGVIDGLTSTGFKSKNGKSFLTSPYLGRYLVGLIRSTEGK